MEQKPYRTVTFFPTNTLYMNPHKGFTTFQRCKGDCLNENWTKETGWQMELMPTQDRLEQIEIGDGYPDTSIAYYRIPWRMLEKQKGVYDFSFLDMVLDRADKRGQKVILRFPPNAARPERFELPQWMIDELNLPKREVGDKRTPDHPLYFETYSNFIKAVGKHIDGDHRVSSVDMAIISAWGENDQICTVKEKDWKRIVDAYMQSITKTPIVAQFNHIPSIEYANTYRPVGIRIDCLGDMEIVHMADLYPRIFARKSTLWQKAPISMEVGWVLKHWLDKNWDIDFIIEQSLLWHISTFNEKSARIPDSLMPKVEEWIKKMGYRFAVRVADFPEKAKAGDTLNFSFCMQNLGVAPIYHKYPFIIRLKAQNGTVYDFDTGENITEWLPGDFLSQPKITLPQNIKKGIYSFELGITDGETVVRMANPTENDNGFDIIGTIEIE